MPRILVIGPSWVGDLVMMQSMLQVLRHRYPNSIIDVFAPKWCAELLKRMSEVRMALTLPLAHGELALSKRYQLGRSLRRNYDVAYVLPNSWKSALLPFAARIPKRIGYKGEFRYGLLTECRRLDKSALPQMVARFVALAQDEGVAINEIPQPKLVANNKAKVIAKYDLDVMRKPRIAALCPGTAGAKGKQWPVEHYIALAAELVAKGFQVWLLGSPNDKPVITAIRKAVRQCIDLGGKVPLIDKVDLLALADIAVTNDSGLMHVAAAVGCAVVGLYGVTDPVFAPPLTTNKIIISNYSAAITKQQKGDQAFIAAITVAEVMAAVDKLVAIEVATMN